MLLTITNNTPQASDVGFLLHKHPGKVQTFKLAFGQAHVFYPQADSERCTACLLLDIDPIGLVRNHRGPSGESRSLDQYVNDRPYVASSFMSVAIAQVYGSALSGKCKDRPELVDQPLSLEAQIEVLPARGGGEGIIKRLFEPLGYEVDLHCHVLDSKFDWGDSPYYSVGLRTRRSLH